MTNTGLSDEDNRAYTAAQFRFKLRQFAVLTEEERECIRRCQRMFEAMLPGPEVILEPGPRPGSFWVRVISQGKRNEPRLPRCANVIVPGDFIGPRRRGCIQRDEDGELFVDRAGASTPWPTGERAAAVLRKEPAAPAAGGV